MFLSGVWRPKIRFYKESKADMAITAMKEECIL
jgi:hypothetical protein